MGDSDSDDEVLSEFEDEQDDEEEIELCQKRKTTKKVDVLPNVSAVTIKDWNSKSLLTPGGLLILKDLF